MTAYFVLFACVAAALLAGILRRAYFYLPKKELLRRVYNSSPEFRKLQMVAKYGLSARFFLSSAEFILAASAIIIAGRSFQFWVALLTAAVLFVLLKIVSSKDSTFGRRLATAVAPYFAKMLYYIVPLCRAVKRITPSRFKQAQTTRIYETEDLQDFIKLQQRAANNRIPKNELTAVLNALDFGGKQIKDHMIPRPKIHFVSAKDPIGPILLSELHKSGFTCFPVMGNSENEVVAGWLYLDELAKHTEGGLVGQAMEEKVVYIGEDKPLEDFLQAASKTGRQEFVVINSQARITGIITLKEVLAQMTGHSAKSSFDDYDDPSAVAKD